MDDKQKRLEEKLATRELVLQASLSVVRMDFFAVVGIASFFYFMCVILYASNKLDPLYFWPATVIFGLQIFFAYLTYSALENHKGFISRLKNILEDKSNKEVKDGDR